MSDSEYVEIGEPVERESGTYRVCVAYDSDMPNPRDDIDYLGTMVCRHRRYTLPCEGDLTDVIDDALQRGGLRLAIRYLSVVHGAVALPVYGYDHGQLRLKAGERTYPFDDRWDSGIAGVIYARRADIANEWAGFPIPTDDDIAGYLKAEVEQYDTWANGEMTGYVIQKRCDAGEWHDTDSCWGYFSVDEAMEQGVEALPD